MVVEALVAENRVNKKIGVDWLLVKLLGIEELYQASYSGGALFFHFSNSGIGFNALDKSWAKAYPSKKQKHKKKKKMKNKFNP